MNVLIVEDDNALRRFLDTVLTMEGHATFTAADGAEAVEKLRRHSFDLIISDMYMPLMNGLELLRHVFGNYPSTPFVMTSGDFNQNILGEAKELNAYAFLSKPFNVGELLELVKYVQHAHLERVVSSVH
jgi:DNA-binding NtrC family response regulator